MSKHPEPAILEKSRLSTCLSNFGESNNLEEAKSIFTNTMNIVEAYENIADYKNMAPITYPPRVEDTITIPSYSQLKNSNNHRYNLVLREDDEPNVVFNINTEIEINEKHKQVINMPAKKWDALTQFYIGSLSVVGLYILFRAMKK